MLKNKEILFGLITILGIMFVPTSDAILWDLLIQTTIEHSPLFPDTQIILGLITDHASKPVSNAQVNIRSGQDSIFTATDEQGKFRIELSTINRIPGTHIVNIIASTAEGKTGIMSTEFHIKGDLTSTSVIEEKLMTQEALKYLSASPDDFKKDPIGFILYNHYQKLFQEYIGVNEMVSERDISLEQQNKNADDFEDVLITPQAFSGNTYDEYINSLDPPIKNLVTNHLELTIKIFDEAQQIQKTIMDNGGSGEDALLAYLEYIAISKETLENFGFDIGNETTNNYMEQAARNQITSNGENIAIQTNLAGMNIIVEGNGTLYTVSVNGIITVFEVDENKNVQIINTKK